jgi:hypothetical protein
MVKSVNVIGRGRAGTAIAARLEERGVELRAEDAELTLLCVPDTGIRDVAQGLSLGHGPSGHGRKQDYGRVLADRRLEAFLGADVLTVKYLRDDYSRIHAAE